ncbi:MAG: hypothetical protein QW279_04545 [Candidatus Jordarchaeaceae archaeon]
MVAVIKKMVGRVLCYICHEKADWYCEDCGHPVCATHSTVCRFCGKHLCINCDY